MDLDLDDVQNEEEMDSCLSMLWRYSEFAADLRARNPSITASNIRDLTPGAFLTFVTGDRRHLERALGDVAASNVPAVASATSIPVPATPATAAFKGTPASIMLSDPPQTEAIELEPFDSVISLTTGRPVSSRASASSRAVIDRAATSVGSSRARK